MTQSKYVALTVMAVSLMVAGCNRSSNSGSAAAPNSASAVATADTDSEPVVFEPTAMAADLSRLVGNGVDGDPVALVEGDTVESVLERLGN